MATTWDSGFKAATISLTALNLKATSSTAVTQLVRSTTSVSRGKPYWEMTLQTVTNDIAVGLCNASTTTAPPSGIGSGNDANSLGFYAVNPPQSTYINGVSINSGGSASIDNETISLAADIPNNLLWISTTNMRSTSHTWNNSLSADPVAGTGGISLAALAAGPYYACFNDDLGGAIVAANFGKNAFTWPMPTGWSSWDALTDPTTEDKWHQAPPQPARTNPGLVTRLTSGATSPLIAAATGDIVLVDRWQRTPPQPARPTARFPALQAGVSQSLRSLLVIETVTLDKWYQSPVMLPNRRITRHPALSAPVAYQAVTVPPPSVARARPIVHWFE